MMRAPRTHPLIFGSERYATAESSPLELADRVVADAGGARTAAASPIAARIVRIVLLAKESLFLEDFMDGRTCDMNAPRDRVDPRFRQGRYKQPPIAPGQFDAESG